MHQKHIHQANQLESSWIVVVGNDLALSEEDQWQKSRKGRPTSTFRGLEKGQSQQPYAINLDVYSSPSPSALATTTWEVANTGRPLGPCFQCGQVGHIQAHCPASRWYPLQCMTVAMVVVRNNV